MESEAAMDEWKVVRVKSPKDGSVVERFDRDLEKTLNRYGEEGCRLYRMADAARSMRLVFVRSSAPTDTEDKPF